MVNLEWKPVYGSLIKRFTVPKEVCGELNFCAATKKILDFNDFKTEVLAGKPANNDWPTPTGKNTYKVL